MSQRLRARARAAAAGLTAGCATADIPARYHTLSNTRATLLLHDWLRCCRLPLLVLPHRCCHTAPAAWARLGCYYADMSRCTFGASPIPSALSSLLNGHIR